MLLHLVAAAYMIFYLWLGARTTPILIKSGWIDWEEPNLKLKMSRREQMRLASKAAWLTATWLVRILPYWRVWTRIW